jgi:hypothetical protein
MPGHIQTNPSITHISKVLWTFISFLVLGWLIAGYQNWGWISLDLIFGVLALVALFLVMILTQWMVMFGWNQAYEHDFYGTAIASGVAAYLIYVVTVATLNWSMLGVFTLFAWTDSLIWSFLWALILYVPAILNSLVTVEVEAW